MLFLFKIHKFLLYLQAATSISGQKIQSVVNKLLHLTKKIRFDN